MPLYDHNPIILPFSGLLLSRPNKALHDCAHKTRNFPPVFCIVGATFQCATTLSQNTVYYFRFSGNEILQTIWAT